MARPLKKVKPSCLTALVDHTGPGIGYARNYVLVSIPEDGVPKEILENCVDADFLPFTFTEVSRDIIVDTPGEEPGIWGTVLGDSMHLANPFVEGNVFRQTFNQLKRRVLNRVEKFDYYHVIYEMLIDKEGQPVYACVDPNAQENNQGPEPLVSPVHCSYAGNYLYKRYEKGIVAWNCATTMRYPTWVLDKLYSVMPTMLPSDPAMGFFDVVKAMFKQPAVTVFGEPMVS